MTTVFDQVWKPEQAKAAHDEGWMLVIVVDEHKPISTAYLEIFPTDPGKSRHQAMTHVMANARTGKRLHIDALSACSSTKTAGAAAQAKAKPRKR